MKATDLTNRLDARARAWVRDIHSFESLSSTNDFLTAMRVQSLSQSRSVRKFENAAIVNDPGADIAALQRNDPDPPAATEKMVRGPFACGTTMVRVIGKSFAPFVAVPILHVGKAGPDGVDRVLGVLLEVSQLAREHRAAAAGIY